MHGSRRGGQESWWQDRIAGRIAWNLVVIAPIASLGRWLTPMLWNPSYIASTDASAAIYYLVFGVLYMPGVWSFMVVQQSCASGIHYVLPRQRAAILAGTAVVLLPVLALPASLRFSALVHVVVPGILAGLLGRLVWRPRREGATQQPVTGA